VKTRFWPDRKLAGLAALARKIGGTTGLKIAPPLSKGRGRVGKTGRGAQAGFFPQAPAGLLKGLQEMPPNYYGVDLLGHIERF